MLINIISVIAILNPYNWISTTLELITPTKLQFNWGTTKTIELDIKNLVQYVNGFEAAVTNLKHYNITAHQIISCNLVGSGHLSFAMCGLSNYAQATIYTTYAWTNIIIIMPLSGVNYSTPSLMCSWIHSSECHDIELEFFSNIT